MYVSSSIKKEFDSKPIYNEKYLKTKIKSWKGKIKFYDDGISIEGSHYICLLMILILFLKKIKTIFWK